MDSLIENLGKPPLLAIDGQGEAEFIQSSEDQLEYTIQLRPNSSYSASQLGSLLEMILIGPPGRESEQNPEGGG
jgi:hypothetical protein